MVSNRYFAKEFTQMVKKHMRRSSKSPIIREKQIRTTVRHHFPPTGIAMIKKLKSTHTYSAENSAGADVEKWEFGCCRGNV
jgi:hypothetical protein